MGIFKRHGDTQRTYRNAADKYDSEWVSSEVTGEEPTQWDDIQSAPFVPTEGYREDGK